MKRFFGLLSGIMLLTYTLGAQSYRLHREQQDYFVFFVPTSSMKLVDFASLYKIPSYQLALLNKKEVTDSIYKGMTIKLPILSSNLQVPSEGEQSLPIITKVTDLSSLESLQEQLKVSTFSLININNVNRPDELIGGYFTIGYLLPTETIKSNLATSSLSKNADNISAFSDSRPPQDHLSSPPILIKDSNQWTSPLLPIDSLNISEFPSEYGLQYEQQLKEGFEQNANGAAVFYKSKSASDAIYALYNLAPIGSIIKIINPSNKKTVYAKVIGKLPPTERYKNAIIGISGNAGPALQAKDFRLFVQTFYVL